MPNNRAYILAQYYPNNEQHITLHSYILKDELCPDNAVYGEGWSVADGAHRERLWRRLGMALKALCLTL